MDIEGELTLQSQVSNIQLPTLNTQVEVEQEVEGYFLKAIDIARQQQAKSIELRATVSLTRLWRRQGKTSES
jgi:hypothetical protein